MTMQVGLNVSLAVHEDADPIGDARHAETLGFDFVSASDHPGANKPNYETWTALTWMAAATERISVVTRVLAVPLRRPAMIAKSAETLHRLSHGRVILGLGAGYAKDELRSYGATDVMLDRRLLGLRESLHIIRALWTCTTTDYSGQIYQAHRASLEPKPSAQIPIWLGAFGPRALELTGQLADGWIPSRGYMPDADIPVMRSRVMDAAVAAGRDPQQITCALNVTVSVNRTSRGGDPFSGPVGQVVEALLGYATLGFTSFNLTIDGPQWRRQAAVLAEHALPALRSAAG
jgi:alkanesulfonate monooxygenase SsuD/methylene tetrahydromethanopterin reductase-like flavin-dependent oxidoreductase (luciferase family)